MMKLEELNKEYTDAETCDKPIFSEMRSNLLLIDGQHYAKNGSSFFDRVRTAKDISPEQKIRLTKNHTQKIFKIYSNNISSYAPWVNILPKNDSELQDRKAADLHQAVWEDAKDRKGYGDMVADWCDTFVGIGEIFHEFYFDPDGGDVLGYQPSDEIGEDGQPTANMDAPVMSGSVESEEYYGFNVLRAPEAKSIDKSPYLILRKMVKIDDLKKKYPEHAEKIKGSENKSFLVFDTSSSTSSYKKSEPDETLLRKHYFRPCAKYPRGWYAICLDSVVLEENELPLDNQQKPVFPVISECFEKIPTTPRGRSIIKQTRPYQAEINRCSSKIAEHQITLGDDKLILQNGSKSSAGVSQPGIRVVTVTGQEPTVIAGRSGDQYLPYLSAQIAEMYQVAMIAEDIEKAQDNDIFASLFKSAKQKKVFQRYIGKFEKYLKRFCMMYLKMCKMYMHEESVILAVGKKERINIAEFKSTSDLSYQIKVEARAEDIETQYGQQIVMNHLIQYVGSNPNMSREDLGKFIKNMPFANLSEEFDDLTIDYENVTNDMLMMERGEEATAQQFENHEYIINKINKRMKMADFRYLHEHVRMLYQKYLDTHLQMLDVAKKEAERAKQGLIPTSGPLVAVDFYTQYDPTDPSKTRRARVPNDAMAWLLETLEGQGVVMDKIDSLPVEMQAQMAQVSQPQQPPQQGEIPNG